MKNKKVILALAAFVVVIAAFITVYFATRPETVEGAKTFTLTVIHKDATSKEFEFHTDEEFLGAVLMEEGLLEGEMGEFGLYIKSVDGEVADYNVDGAYWGLFEGEEYAMQGIDQTPIEDGDTFKLVYTIG